jgi:transposase-like protein
MAKTRRPRKTYTLQQRSTILEAARKEGLTAKQVKAKFGVTPVTYYSWRKKTGATGRRGRPVGSLTATLRTGGSLDNQVRNEVRSRVQQILPEIVRGEVSNYLDTLFAGSRRGRRKQHV